MKNPFDTTPDVYLPGSGQEERAISSYPYMCYTVFDDGGETMDGCDTADELQALLRENSADPKARAWVAYQKLTATVK